MTPARRIRAAVRAALLVVESDAMKGVVDRVVEVAACDAPAVVEGERGTGREMLARLIHHVGPRQDAAFVTVEAAAAPSPLFRDGIAGESGGPLERAAGGTLLVKNLCALGVRAQRRLARVLRARAASGDDRSTEVLDLRILGACGRDFDDAVASGGFDRTIYDAMVGHRIVVPPLRDRVVDIPPLAVHFVRACAREIGRGRMTLSTRAFERLATYPWPGNVAELKDVARQLVVSTRGSRVEAADVDALLPTVAERVPLEELSLEQLVRAKLRAFLRRVDGYPVSGLYDEVLGRVERELLTAVLAHTGGNQLRAAEVLGVNRNTLRRRLAGHGIAARTIRATARSRVSAVKAAAGGKPPAAVNAAAKVSTRRPRR